MVKIKILSGPSAGEIREMPADADPMSVFQGLADQGWDWKVDYSGATEEETLLWFRAEIAVRIIRALTRGLPVEFLGRKWRIEPDDDPFEVVCNLEDAIVASGRLISIDSDDERGLVIGVRGIVPRDC